MRGSSCELLLDPQAELRKRRLLELARPKKRPARRTCRQRVWFYATSLFAMTAVSAGSSLLFLVPLYVDPAISTLAADFTPQPVTCVTARRDDRRGINNCTWSSCREGCTSDMYACTHIFVSYHAHNLSDSPTTPTPLSSSSSSSDVDDFTEEAVLLVNIKGCGYPPEVRCAEFNTLYGEEGAHFPCYYSRQNRTIVMTSYDRDKQVEVIINYFAIPFVVTLVTSVVLCVMHCDCRNATTPPRSFRRARVEDASDCSISTRVDRIAASQQDLSRPL